MRTSPAANSGRFLTGLLVIATCCDSKICSEFGHESPFVSFACHAFAYMENWPITVTQSAPGSDEEFNNDIVVRFKASERGAAAVLNPRYVVKCTAG